MKNGMRGDRIQIVSAFQILFVPLFCLILLDISLPLLKAFSLPQDFLSWICSWASRRQKQPLDAEKKECFFWFSSRACLSFKMQLILKKELRVKNDVQAILM